MRSSLLVFALLFTAPLAHAQTGTFTFSTTPPDYFRSAVTETVGGVTLTITATGAGANRLDVSDWGDWAGTNGAVTYNNDEVNSLLLSFGSPVNVASLRLGDGHGDGSPRTFVVTPNTGSPVTFTDSNDIGATVAPAGGFAGITTLTITLQEGGPFFILVDDIVMDASLPVELTAFSATADGGDALLAWQTASETNNAGFDVQQHAGGTWRSLGFVPGHGTTLEGEAYTFRAGALAPGTHRFRLEQVDFDGTATFSPEVELTIAPRGARLVVPATFTHAADVHLGVERGQRVRVTVFDLLGRSVASLFEGHVAETLTVTLDGSALPSGLYFVRAEGEAFATTRQTVLVR